jgi:hypothetical protein
VGRDTEARHWLERAADADPDDETGVHERLDELEGIVVTDLENDAEDAEDADAEDAEPEDGLRPQRTTLEEPRP